MRASVGGETSPALPFVIGRLHARRAVEITDLERWRELVEAMSRKYGFDVSLATGYMRFFRLEPRQAKATTEPSS